MDFSYKRFCQMTFVDAVEAVERCVRSHGFIVERAHDIQARLASKGFKIQPLRIYELQFASEEPPFTGIDGEFRRCRVQVYVEGDAVFVSAIRSTVLMDADDDSPGCFEEIEHRVADLVDEIAGQDTTERNSST
ncbi:MAG: hypothetical protein D9V44_01650 [Actinobacteria bacterium]|nr:MAG: hypothetical protein D9V44_01650 [Actinomycetota bacterium]